MGVVLAASGGSLLAVKVVQIVLGAVAVWLAGDAARRLFDDRASVPAAALLAACGVVVFHESVLLQAALDPFLTALALWLLLRALDGAASFARFFAAGLALGLFAMNRPNVLPWAAVAAALIVAARGIRHWRMGFAFALGTTLGVAPAPLRNLLVAREPVLVSSHGGLNFLVGNGPGANGVYRSLDGITPSIAGQAADARKVAEAEEGRALSSREVSSHFARKAWAWIAAEPRAAARLFARKVWYVFSSDEAPLNFSYPWDRGRSLVLRLLAVGPSLLVPLGGVGLAVLFLASGRFPKSDAAVWASFVPAYALLVGAFFVATRYRLPLYVPLAAAGGGAAVALVDSFRARRGKVLLLAALVATPLAALSLWPTGLYDGAADEETEWILHLIGSGEAASAGEASKRAEALAAIHPEPGVFWFRVGQAWAATGRLDDGIAALEKSLALDREQVETKGVLSKARERRGLEKALAGNGAAALPDLEAAAALDPKNASARLNLAAVLAERGERDRARRLAEEALALQPGYEKAEALLRALGGGARGGPGVQPRRGGGPPR
jgi:hypothetical protein